MKLRFNTEKNVKTFFIYRNSKFSGCPLRFEDILDDRLVDMREMIFSYALPFSVLSEDS